MRRLALMLLIGIFLLSSLAEASDAIIAYRSNTGTYSLNSPKIKVWNSSLNGGWGSEMELPTSGSPVRWVIVKQSPVSEKMVGVTLSDDGNLDGYVCMSGCNSTANWGFSGSIGNVWAVAANNRRFDIEFETATGDLLLVYGVNDANTSRDLAYKVLPASRGNFTGLTEQYIDDSGHATNVQYTWVRLDRKPTASEELLLVGFDSTDSDINSWVWNGSTWNSQAEISSSATVTGGYEALAVRYSADGSKGMAAGGNYTTGNVTWRYWNGSVWSAAATFDIDPADANDVRWMSLKADPQGDDLQMVVTDSGSDLGTVWWNGTSWNLTSNIDTGLDSNAQRCADFSWNPAGSAGWLLFDTDGVGATISRVNCTPRCNSTPTTQTGFSGTGAWITMYTNPTSSDLVQILGARLISTFDIGSFRFNATSLANYGNTNITADTTVVTFESYSIAFPPKSTCMHITSPGTYVLRNNVTGYPFVPTGSGNACIWIESSDVVFDCRGYEVSIPTLAGTSGIFLNNRTNVTVKNCRITGYSNGMWLENVSGSAFQNNTLHSNNKGIFIDPSYNNTLINNTFFNNSEYGLQLLFSYNNTLVNNTAYNNSQHGFVLYHSDNNTLVSNTAYDNNISGIYLWSSHRNNLTGNVAHHNIDRNFFLAENSSYNNLTNNSAYGGLHGILLGENCHFNNVVGNLAWNNTRYGINLQLNASFNNVSNNRAYLNGWSGFHLSFSHNNSLANNTAYGNTMSGFEFINSSFNNSVSRSSSYLNLIDGFQIYNSSMTSLINSSANSNQLYGIEVYVSNGTDLSDSVVFNNTGADVLLSVDDYVPRQVRLSNLSVLNPSGSNQNYTRLFIDDLVGSPLIEEAYLVKWSSNPAPLPANHPAFANKYVNISVGGGTVSIDRINWTWFDSELTGYNETRFELWRHNNALGWVRLNFTPDTAANTLGLSDMDPASVYGILQNNESECMVINAPGAYSIANNLSGASIPSSEVTDISWACIKIASSNVDFSCNGFNITNNGTGSAAAIVVNGSLSTDYTNVTIRDCPSISGYRIGAYVHLSDLDTVRNCTSNNNSQAGFYVLGSYRCRIDNNTANGSSSHGYYIRDSYYNNLSNDIASSNGHGFYVITSQFTNITGGQAFNNSGNGFYVWAAEDSDVPNMGSSMQNCTSRENGENGFRLTYSTYAMITGSSASNNSLSGFYADSNSNDSVIDGCFSINNSEYGFRMENNHRGRLYRNLAQSNNMSGGYLFSSNNNTVWNNTFFSNRQYGILVYVSDLTAISDCHVYNNTEADLLASVDDNLPRQLWAYNLTIDNPYGTFQNYTRLYIDDIVGSPLIEEAYLVKWSAEPPSPPFTSFAQKYVNITVGGGEVSIDHINWTWHDSELTGYDEGSFELWKYNSSGWLMLNDTPDTAYNVLGMTGMDPSSDYGILQDTSLDFLNISASPNPQGFGLNVTISVDVPGASAAMIGITAPASTEINFTMVNTSSSHFEFNYSNWVNGTYAYTIYANDSLGFWHNSSIYGFDLYQNLAIQVRTLQAGYTVNQTINLTDPDSIDPEAPVVLGTAFGDFDNPPSNGEIVKVIVNVTDRYGISTVQASIPTLAGEDVIKLGLAGGDGYNGTWVAEWLAHDVIGEHYVMMVEARNIRNKSDYAYVSMGDPPGLWVVPENDSDPTALWADRPNARDGDTHTYASDNSNPGGGWGSFIIFNITSIESDRARVLADYGPQVGSIDVDVYRDGGWADAYEGSIPSLQWAEINFTSGNVTAGRFRYNYTVGGWIYWLYEFQFYNVSTQVNLPVVSTKAATSVEENNSILHATVLSDGGDGCQVRFLYGNSTSYTDSTPWRGPFYTGSSMGEMIYGLEEGTTYHFIAQINNSAGLTNGSDQSFTAAPASIGWVTPTNFSDPDGQWSQEPYAFDDELYSEAYSYHEVNDPDGVWSFYLYLNRSTTLSDKIRFNAKATDVDLANVDVYINGSWVTVFNNSFTDSAWTEASFNQSNVSQARIRFRAVANNRGFDWAISEFDFYKQLTTSPENQSKLENGGPTNASCYLLMKTQFWNGGAWLDDDIVLNDSSPRVLAPYDILKLDTLWNPLNYSTSNLSFGDGTYRAYAACIDNSSGVLTNLNGSLVNSGFNFTYDSSPPLVNITSPLNGSNHTLFSTIPISANVTDDSGVSTVLANVSNSLGSEIIAMTYNSTSGLWGAMYSNTNYVDTYSIRIIATDINGAVNDTEFVVIFITDVTAPDVILVSPPDNSSSGSSGLTNITFVCNATDDYDVQNISLFITNSSNQSFSFNQSVPVSGVYASANFSLMLGAGNYSWNCLAFDSYGNSEWGDSNWSLYLNQVCRMYGTVEGAFGSPTLSDVRVSYSNGSFVENQSESYDFYLTCNETYDLEVIPYAGSFNRLKVNGINLTSDVFDVVDMEDAPETAQAPEWVMNWTQVVAWKPNDTMNYSHITINISYSGDNLAFYKCASWNYSGRNCTDNNYSVSADVMPGSNLFYVANFSPGDPEGGVAHKPNVTSFLRVYDVTGLNETQRRDNGTLIGTFFNGSLVNFSYGKSYRLEIFLNNSDNETNGTIMDPFYDNIQEELGIDMSGADGPNVTVVAGSVILNPFTPLSSAGTQPGTRRLTWDADSSDRLIESLNLGDVVKLWLVADFNTTQTSLNDATFVGGVLGSPNVTQVNPFNTMSENCPVITTPGSYLQTQNYVGAMNNVTQMPNFDKACVVIMASDVSYSCGGFNITNNGSTGSIAIAINGTNSTTYSNVTIHDCGSLDSYSAGIAAFFASDLTFENNVISDSRFSGIECNNTNRTTLTNNSVTNTTFYGIYLISSNMGNLTGNTAFNNAGPGFRVVFGDGINLTGNNASGNLDYGFRFDDSNGSMLLHNIAFNNSRDGFMLIRSDNFSITGCNSTYNNASGFLLYDHSENNFFYLNNASSNNITGFYMNYDSTYNTLSNNFAFNNAQYGFHMLLSDNNTMSSNLALQNNLSGVFLRSSCGVNLSSNTASRNSQFGLQMALGSNNTFTYNNTWESSQRGVSCGTSYDSAFINDTARNNTQYGFIISSGARNNISGSIARNNTLYGMYIDNSNNSRLADNIANNNLIYGFYVRFGTNNTMSGNTAYNNTSYGMVYDSSPYGNLSGNVAYNNFIYGIVVSSSSNSMLDGNTAYNNSRYGFYVRYTDNSTLDGNAAYNNSEYGFYFESADNDAMTGNNATYNVIGGMALDGWSSNNTLSSNYVCFNDRMDLNNSNSTNSGSLDRCDYWQNWTENAHTGCEFTCSEVWHRFFGNVSGNLLLAPNNASIFYRWLWDGRFGRLYAVNADVSISWANLTALGRNTTGQNSTGDFSELDITFGMGGLRDSVTELYTAGNGSVPTTTSNMTLWNHHVPYVPQANSSTETSFQTGITWDASQDTGDGEFDGEDTAFVTEINGSAQYDYDIRVPEALATYTGSSGRVGFWVELG